MASSCGRLSSTCCGEGPHRALSRRACECAGAHGRSRREWHALARIVHRVLALFHGIVRFRLDHCHHVSAYGATRRWWMACTTCGRRVRVCLASSEGGKRIAERIRARCASGEPADGQPVASDSSTAAKLFDVSACCRVRACALLASRARVVRACRACSARVCSCARQASQPRKSSIAAKHRKQSTSLFVFARAFLNFACLKLHRVPEAETRTVKLLRRRAQLLSITFWNAAHT